MMYAVRPVVRPAADADRSAVADVLARAFIDDPAMAYLFRDAADRPRRLRKFFDLIGSADADAGQWDVAIGPQGAPVATAMWRPPGLWQTPATAMLRLLPRLVGAFGLALPRALALQSVMEAHHPHTPHWYLQFTGCVPEHQGKGYGGAAIRARLAQCDAQGLPAALETATESNLGFYQALGFAIADTYDIKGGPTFWTMWREPR
ncbi:MAG: GNAT family N-acetyltransferase [Polymorphobacter sp.]